MFNWNVHFYNCVDDAFRIILRIEDGNIASAQWLMTCYTRSRMHAIPVQQRKIVHAIYRNGIQTVTRLAASVRLPCSHVSSQLLRLNERLFTGNIGVGKNRFPRIVDPFLLKGLYLNEAKWNPPSADDFNALYNLMMVQTE